MILKITVIITLSVDRYLLKYDNQNILLVAEESCTNKKNTVYICSNAFHELAALLMDEYSLPEAGSPTEALSIYFRKQDDSYFRTG